jgi:hypothetical protein
MENNTKLTKKQFLNAAGPAFLFIVAAVLMSCGGNKGGAMEKGANIKCADCPMRARYDRDPKLLLSRLWKWHIGWCPGWKSYLASLPEDERKKIMERYR